MFNITKGGRKEEPKGIHITLANGWLVSVQWGYGNYCDNKVDGDPSPNAEVAAWDDKDGSDRMFYKDWPDTMNHDGSGMLCSVTPDQLIDVLNLVRTFK